MAGVEPHEVIGEPDADGERRARQVAAGLDSPRSGRRIHTLLALAELWFPVSSCFHPRPPHALPTRALLERVAGFLGEDHEDAVRMAAMVATRAGWRALAVIGRKRPEEASRWEIPIATVTAVGGALGAASNLLRINAARLAAEFPSMGLLPALRASLGDELWTVRWNAVTALAALDPNEELIEVLRQSPPPDPQVRSPRTFAWR